MTGKSRPMALMRSSPNRGSFDRLTSAESCTNFLKNDAVRQVGFCPIYRRNARWPGRKKGVSNTVEIAGISESDSGGVGRARRVASCPYAVQAITTDMKHGIPLAFL
jgi:hypothetical protein